LSGYFVDDLAGLHFAGPTPDCARLVGGLSGGVKRVGFGGLMGVGGSCHAGQGPCFGPAKIQQCVYQEWNIVVMLLLRNLQFPAHYFSWVTQFVIRI